MNQCGRVPFPSVRILIFLRGAISAISMMKLSSWPRSNLQGLEGRPRRCFFFPAPLQPLCVSIPCRSPGHANSLKSKVYECSLLDLSFPALQQPATVLLARHLSADLTGIPPSLGNTAHLELLQAACSIHCRSVCNQNNRDSQAGFCTSPPSWHSTHLPVLGLFQIEGKIIFCHISFS